MDWQQLWVEKYRPKTINDIALSQEVKDFLLNLKSDNIPNILFSGPPGVGKTSLSKILVDDILKCQYIYINGSEESSIDVVRNKILGFAQTKSFDGKVKIVFIDEAEALSSNGDSSRSSAQKALKNVIEEYSNNTRFIFTTNNPEHIIEPILSRFIHFRLNLDYKDCLKRVIAVLKAEKVNISKDMLMPLQQFVEANTPDLRHILKSLQRYSITGDLIIPKESNYIDFSKNILDKTLKKADLFELRKEIVENEAQFGGNYHELLKNMYNLIISDAYSNIPQAKRIQTLLILADSIVHHFSVDDKEINFSATLFKIYSLN